MIRLKIKIKSLAEEARIIRCEEKKFKANGRFKNSSRRTETNFELHEHRISIVRPELRNCYLAYAFIRGKKRVSVERNCYVDPNYAEIARLAYTYGYAKLRIIDKASFVKSLCNWIYADSPYDIGSYQSIRDETSNVIARAIKM